jgi:Icc-related predicted phosphoesterase
MKIAVFSDLHGRIFLCLKLVDRLQRERNIQIDLILQCGDMGIFPNPQTLDKATLKHAKRDPTELGFCHYFVKPQPQVATLLEKLTCDMVCVRGNHEDHDFLNQLEAQTQAPRFAVDCYQRIFISKTGKLQTFQFGDAQINIVGIGRIGLPAHKNPNENQKYIQPYEKATLEQLKKHPNVNQEGVDILITHDSPLNFVTTGFGMSEIHDFLMSHQPIYHFFGHTGTPYDLQLFDNKVTQSCKIAELTWEKSGLLPEGGMVLINWQNRFDNQIEVINDEWLKEYTRAGWKYL